MTTEMEAATPAPPMVLPDRWWPTVGLSGECYGWETKALNWNGGIETLTPEEKVAFEARRLFLVWATDVPGEYCIPAERVGLVNPITGRAQAGVTTLTVMQGEAKFRVIRPYTTGLMNTSRIGLLHAIRPKSWAVAPPSYRWTGALKQIRKRKLGSFRRWRVYLDPADTDVEVWPAAFLWTPPADAVWFEDLCREQQYFTYLDSGGYDQTIGHYSVIVNGAQRLPPWGRAISQPASIVPYRYPQATAFVGKRFHNPFTGERNQVTTDNLNPTMPTAMPDTHEAIRHILREIADNT